jgi:transcriptional repressor NrdR
VTCPTCSAETRVLESRRSDDGAAVRRRRECRQCGRRFTTFERREPEPAWVRKRSGERQRFDRSKLTRALTRATHKLDIDPRELELIVNRVEGAAEEAGGELSAERISELSLEGLDALDHRAYLQFAGTLRDAPAELPRNPRKDGRSGGSGSVRTKEDAPRPTPRHRTRGEN